MHTALFAADEPAAGVPLEEYGARHSIEFPVPPPGSRYRMTCTTSAATSFTTFAPHVFQHLRQIRGIREAQFYESLARSVDSICGRAGDGKSAATFYDTADKQFMVQWCGGAPGASAHRF